MTYPQQPVTNMLLPLPIIIYLLETPLTLAYDNLNIPSFYGHRLLCIM